MPEQSYEMSEEEKNDIRVRNTRAWEDVKNRTGLETAVIGLDPKAQAFLEEEYLGASNGIAGAKLPLPLEDRQYPEHEKLIEHIMDLVAGNIEGSRDVQHAREILDDILIDLTYLKNAIGTPEQYLKKGLL